PQTAPPSTTPTSRPSTTVSSTEENSPKSLSQPQCENSSSSQTPSCEKIDSGSPDTLDSHHRCSSGPIGRSEERPSFDGLWRHLPPQGGKETPTAREAGAALLA